MRQQTLTQHVGLFIRQLGVRRLEVFLQRQDRAEGPSAQRAFGGVADHVILRVQLQLVQRLEGQTALRAAVLVGVSFGYGRSQRQRRLRLRLARLHLVFRTGFLSLIRVFVLVLLLLLLLLHGGRQPIGLFD